MKNHCFYISIFFLIAGIFIFISYLRALYKFDDFLTDEYCEKCYHSSQKDLLDECLNYVNN